MHIIFFFFFTLERKASQWCHQKIHQFCRCMADKLCVHLPSLLCDDHLCLVSVKLQPQGPVAQIHLCFPRNQSCLRGGELVKSPSLVSVSILLRVRVARRRVALRRSVGQKAVVSSISYDRVMGHITAGTSNRESRVRWSMLARVREHGTGSC